MTAPASVPWIGAPVAPLTRKRTRQAAGGLAVDLREGVEFLLDGERRRVQKESVRTVDGLPVMALARPDGVTELVPLRDLLFLRTVRPLGPEPDSSSPYPHRCGQETEVADLTAAQLGRLQDRLAHALEADTGYRSGDAWTALPDEPKPQYDPALVPDVTKRRRSKVEELRSACATLGPEGARKAGVDQMSARTLQRLALRWHKHRSLDAVMDHRHVRPPSGHRVSEPFEQAIYEVEDDFPVTRSRVSKATKYRRLCIRLRTKGVPEQEMPSYATYRRVLIERFGPTGARQKYRVTQEAMPTQGQPVIATRPGQIVFLDTNSFDVLVRDGLFGLPVEAKLTLALDVYTRSIVGFRFTLVSDKSVDVAMVIRDVMMPMPMRPEWGEDAVWPYPGVPAHVVAEHAGFTVAGRPFMPVEGITTDHGSVYVSHHVVALSEECGSNFLPARKMRARDKHAVELTFRMIRQLLLEELPGYRGMDVADRGVDPEGDASMTLEQAERYLAWFVVHVWQARALGQHRPHWCADSQQSPNSLFATSMGQAGWAMQIPDPELYYRLLESVAVKVTERGVLVHGLWYRDDVLKDFLVPSTRGGSRRGKWIVKWDPRDRREVFFQHPDTLEWHHLRWTGLGPEGEFPSFSDATAKSILKIARDRRVRPKTDKELLPLFEEFYERVTAELGDGRRGTSVRKAAAREAQQGAAADRDRPAAPVALASAVETDAAVDVTTDPTASTHDGDGGTVVPFQAARQTQQAVDNDRQKRREQAPATPVRIPLSLRDARRRANQQEDQ